MPVNLGAYRNPIISGFNPDPSWARNGDDIFLVTSTFEYFPGIPIYHSTDLISWTLIGHALTRRSQLDLRTCETGAGIWASTIRQHGGRWYICTCQWSRYRPQDNERVWPRGFFVWTDDIWKSDSWSDPIYFDQPGFDQDLFWDEDGSAYLSTTYRMHENDIPSHIKDLKLSKNFAIHIAKVDLVTGASLTAPKMVRASSAGSGVSEGSHIFKRGQYFYMLTAEGGTEVGHTEWCFRSSEGPLGPWIERRGFEGKPLWYNGSNEQVQCTGHADILDDSRGNWWAVLLGVRAVEKAEGGSEPYSPFGRETYLVPVTWENEWPVFNHGRNVELNGLPSPGLYEIDQQHDWDDKFVGKALTLGWYHRKTPLKRYWDLSKNGGLQLFGGCYPLSSPENSSMVLRKQTALEGIFLTRLEFQPTNPRWEAGVVVWHHESRYASMGVRIDVQGERVLRVEAHGENPKESKSDHRLLGVPHPILLKIHCSPQRYVLSYKELTQGSLHAASFKEVAMIDMRTIMQGPRIGVAYCGAMLGLYSYGEMQSVLVPAKFSFASWQTE